MKYRGLKRVESRIQTHFVVIVLGFHSMIPKSAHSIGDVRIVRRDHAPIAKSTEILGWEEAEAAEHAS